jgi:hypothetical protein
MLRVFSASAAHAEKTIDGIMESAASAAVRLEAAKFRSWWRHFASEIGPGRVGVAIGIEAAGHRGGKTQRGPWGPGVEHARFFVLAFKKFSRRKLVPHKNY